MKILNIKPCYSVKMIFYWMKLHTSAGDGFGRLFRGCFIQTTVPDFSPPRRGCFQFRRLKKQPGPVPDRDKKVFKGVL